MQIFYGEKWNIDVIKIQDIMLTFKKCPICHFELFSPPHTPPPYIILLKGLTFLCY